MIQVAGPCRSASSCQGLGLLAVRYQTFCVCLFCCLLPCEDSNAAVNPWGVDPFVAHDALQAVA